MRGLEVAAAVAPAQLIRQPGRDPHPRQQLGVGDGLAGQRVLALLEQLERAGGLEREHLLFHAADERAQVLAGLGAADQGEE
ncbi:MAG: hypothetical protein GY913_28440 [Proteobacteria bacterium]|nr:hypothetical protein [Pseudomonadota bacterium]MCP4920841.1 hypothetical protein [Pseudomonadota bacterium]